MDYVANTTATTSTGCARARPCCSSAGRASGRTRPARSTRPGVSRGCSARRASVTSSTSGGTTSLTTGRPGSGRSHTTCPDSHERPHDRTPARHRGGLARCVRGARRAPRAGRRRDAAHRADPQRAVRPALPAALLGRDRPARLVVRPAARVAEEGLADGRRLPAEQPVHVPGDGEALRVLRADAARDPRARDVADPAQGAARAIERFQPTAERVQRAVRPRDDRRATSATRSS